MTPDLQSYDHIIVAFSGGKDSIACVLHLLEQGAPRERIELWHHDIDGREGSTLMDWNCTPAYCRAFAEHFGLPLYFSWKVGGFEGEMLRENARTNPVKFQCPDGSVGQAGGKRGKLETRRRFPQQSADLSVRWCSSYLKIDVGCMALTNQPRFREKRTLFVTGERAEESAARKKYKVFEPHRSDLRHGKYYTRHIDQWRAVHGWDEAQVWDILERHRINPHPAYRLGFSRVSCAACIFIQKDHWASLDVIHPERVGVLADYEVAFESTVDRHMSIPEKVACGVPFDMDPVDVAAARSRDWEEPIQVEAWVLPSGAYGENCGAI